MCAKKHDLPDSEKDLFRQAVKPAKRLSHTKAETPRIFPKKPAPTRPIYPHFKETKEEPPVSSNSYLEFSRPGIQYKILRKLKAGQYNIEAILDLHGKTVAETEQALQHFLATCQQKGIRHVLIIHGKGKNQSPPILKNKMNNWLRESDAVLAFCSAKAKNGQYGALYLLLRKIKGETDFVE